jgi:general secretion pathway protein G
MYFSRSRFAARAFTLLELLAALAVVALLSTIVIGSAQRAATAVKLARARAELAMLIAALESYRREHGDYPQTADPAALLQALIGRSDASGAVRARGGRSHLDAARLRIARPTAPDTAADPWSDDAAVLLDPWGAPYRYAYRTLTPWTNPSFVLFSAGPDGQASSSLLSGGFVDSAAAGNADNVVALRP